jgi:hypothetical protein
LVDVLVNYLRIKPVEIYFFKKLLISLTLIVNISGFALIYGCTIIITTSFMVLGEEKNKFLICFFLPINFIYAISVLPKTYYAI